MSNVDDDWVRSAARSVDQLISLDIRERGNADTPSLVHDLYEAARDEAGDLLALSAARALYDEVGFLDTVLLTTGAGVPPWLPYGETDGPPGAIGLAFGLARAVGAQPVIATEERGIEPLRAGARAMGLVDVPYETLSERTDAVSIVPYAEGRDRGDDAAVDLLDAYEPSAVIAVEKLGPNRNDVFSQGQHYEDDHSWVAPLFERAREADTLTIGVGDRGNEIGFGRIEPAVRAIRQDEPDMACRVATDHLVVGAASNWGAYGIEAVLSMLAGTTDAMHGPDVEQRVLEQVAAGGAADATSHLSRPTVDGMTGASQRGVVAILENLVTFHEAEYDKWGKRDLDREAYRP